MDNQSISNNRIIVDQVIADSKLMCDESGEIISIYQIPDRNAYSNVALMIAQTKLKDNIFSIVAYSENNERIISKTHSRFCVDFDLRDPDSLAKIQKHIDLISTNFVWTRVGITRKIKTAWAYLAIVRMRAMAAFSGMISVLLLWIGFMESDDVLPDGLLILLAINVVVVTWQFRESLKLVNWND
jgi:hypothetical protein